MWICDEVHVKGQVTNDPSSKKATSYVVNPEQLNCLDDLYLDVEDGVFEEVAMVVMLSMWRDLDTNYDFILPPVVSASGLDSIQIGAYFTACMTLVAAAGFFVKLVIMNGASPNMTFMDGLMHDSHTNYYYINPHSGRRTYFIFDPHHIMKNVRNALLSSFLLGAKYFSIGVALLSLWSRDLFTAETASYRAGGPSPSSSKTLDTPAALGDAERVHFGLAEVRYHYDHLKAVTKSKELLKASTSSRCGPRTTAPGATATSS
jgi:hypothetical protein